ncbi:MAG: DUF6748 domain-containing protein [Sandaracinaceae bacterium]
MQRPTSLAFFCSIVLVLSFACDGDGGTSDAGVDAGEENDAGARDANVDPMDAGSDAGRTEDAGSDAGTEDGGFDAGADAGSDAGSDAGPTDAGPMEDGGPAADELSYVFRFDTRRCAAPACGGWWMRAVNQESTTCFDGTTADECYVAEIDWSAAGYDASAISQAEGAVGGTIVDGRITTEVILGVTIGGFKARAAWIAEWGTPPTSDGRALTYHHLADNGLACLIPPCFNIGLTALNTGTAGTASGLNLSTTGASGPEQMSGQRALADGTLRAVGILRTDDEAGPGGAFGETYLAAQFYLPL